MNTKLNHIKNWEELAREANWSAQKLAKLCGVSENTLRRHFIVHMGNPTKAWLTELQQHQAIELLCHGYSIKEIAASLGYHQQTNFTRKFKKQWGICPSNSEIQVILNQMDEND